MDGTNTLFSLIIFQNMSLLISERRGKGEIEASVVRIIERLPPTCPTLGNQARNPGMCPDPELNRCPLGSWVNAQTLGHTIWDALIIIKCMQP